MKIPILSRTLILCGAAWIYAAPVNAQSHTPLANCDCPTVHLDDAFCASAMVFEGVPFRTDTVTAVATGTRYPKNPIAHVDVWFRVDRMLKGEAKDSVMISTPFKANECMYRFIAGTSYLVFAQQDHGGLTTNRCTPTRAMDTVGSRFRDSLEFVRTGHRWVGKVPIEKPCD